eukprot:scaffold1985_cov53-Attheya_sp.AAC.1
MVRNKSEANSSQWESLPKSRLPSRIFYAIPHNKVTEESTQCALSRKAVCASPRKSAPKQSTPQPEVGPINDMAPCDP